MYIIGVCPAGARVTTLRVSRLIKHPGSHSRGEHDPYIEPALSSQRACRDQGRITQAAASLSRPESVVFAVFPVLTPTMRAGTAT